MAGHPGIRLLCRTLLTVFRGWLIEARGVANIQPSKGPFILAMNHSQRPEAILAPTWISFLRGGHTVHFMADWNFLMIPVVGGIIAAHEPIVVTRKDAKPRFLNRFKGRYAAALPPFEEARCRIERGRCVGVFPEGTVNRHPEQMLRGYNGAARLALETGVPVVPGGIRFPGAGKRRRVSDLDAFSVEFGTPMGGGVPCADPSPAVVREFHEQIMTSISTLAGKRWQADSRRSKYALDEE
jgi:1-acyl-sn-glycerol-3-phosphate acyltransferase